MLSQIEKLLDDLQTYNRDFFCFNSKEKKIIIKCVADINNLSQQRNSIISLVQKYFDKYEITTLCVDTKFIVFEFFLD